MRVDASATFLLVRQPEGQGERDGGLVSTGWFQLITDPGHPSEFMAPLNLVFWSRPGTKRIPSRNTKLVVLR